MYIKKRIFSPPLLLWRHDKDCDDEILPLSLSLSLPRRELLLQKSRARARNGKEISRCAGDFYGCAATTDVDMVAFIEEEGGSALEVYVEGTASTNIDECGAGEPAFQMEAVLIYTICCFAPTVEPTPMPSPAPSTPPSAPNAAPRDSNTNNKTRDTFWIKKKRVGHE